MRIRKYFTPICDSLLIQQTAIWSCTMTCNVCNCSAIRNAGHSIFPFLVREIRCWTLRGFLTFLTFRWPFHWAEALDINTMSFRSLARALWSRCTPDSRTFVVWGSNWRIGQPKNKCAYFLTKIVHTDFKFRSQWSFNNQSHLAPTLTIAILNVSFSQKKKKN